MKQNKIYKTLSMVLCGGLILSLAGCSSTKEGITTASTNIINVEVAKPEITNIERNKDFVGRIVPNELIAVMPTMPDKVIAINKNVGDFVKKGELLFEMDDSSLKESVELAQSGLEIALIQSKRALGSTVDMSVLQAELAYKTADLEYDTAKENLDDLKDLTDAEIEAMGGEDFYDAQKESLKVALDSARTKLHYAKETYDRTKDTSFDETKQINDAEVQKAEATYKTALDAMGETKVYAPASGVIQQSNVTLHETPSQQEPAMVISGDDVMAVSIGIPEKYLSNVRHGAEVKFKYGDKVYTGIVSEVGIAANEKTGLVDIEVSVSDTQGVFAAGSTITVNFIVESAENTIVIPYKALHIENGEEYVYVNNNGIAEKRVVTLGVVNNTHAEILDGLTVEDTVITTKSSSIGNGVQVKEMEVDMVEATQDENVTSQEEAAK